MKKLISVVIPCHNEEENVENMYLELKNIFSKIGNYSYEHIFIDNASEDRTVSILKEIAKKDKNVKIIVNARDFGQVRSPYYGILQARGDAVIMMACDFQDPPTLIPEFIKKWEAGYKIVVGVKPQSQENIIMFNIRRLYYNVVSRISENVKLLKNFTGFGLYDRQIVEILRKIDDPYPYLRGIICDIGFERAEIEFVQPKRRGGVTNNNLFRLYDIAIQGITSYSKIPLRIAVFLGFLLAVFNILVAAVYFILKILLWNSFTVGIAPLVIGLFFFSSVQLFFLGILGEYIGAIYTQVQNRPLIIEKERINFE
jgi:glycosyltransferase involved in cell wall biosynthesis